MLSKEMMDYINLALGDDILENQEMEFLKRKAQELGDDPVEVEMTVKTLISQIKKQADIEKIKCPNCGAFIDQLTEKCEYCGFEKSITVSAKEEFSKEIFSEKLKELSAEAFRTKKVSVFSRILSTVKIFIIVISLFLFFNQLTETYKYLKVKAGKIEWYPNLTFSPKDYTSNIFIFPKTEEQKKRVETTGEFKDKIRWDNMNEEERLEYKKQREAEIILNPYVNMGFAFMVLIIGLLLVMTFIMPAKKTIYEKQLENDILLYPVPAQRQAIFDLCLQIAYKIEPINKWALIFTKTEKIKARQNRFWTKKINQIYQKVKLSFKKEPQVLNQLKEILHSNNVNV